MAPTLTRARRLPLRNFGTGVLVGIAVGVVGLVAALLVPEMAVPPTVTRVTVANPTPYTLEVELTGADRDGWLVLGALAPESARHSYELVDQGRWWIFRFLAGGVHGGEVGVTRAELARNGWQVSVPADVADRLASKGVAAPRP